MKTEETMPPESKVSRTVGQLSGGLTSIHAGRPIRRDTEEDNARDETN